MSYKLFDGGTTKSIDISQPGAYSSLFGYDPKNTVTRSQAWATVGYCYRCVELRANAISDLPWSVYRGDTEIATAGDADRLEWLGNFTKMLFLTEAALCIVAEAYWHKIRRRTRAPIALQWFAPGTMKPVWSADGLLYFQRNVNSSILRIPPDDVVYYRQPNPLHETEPGPSPVGAALADAGVVWSLNEFAKAFFDRGAIRATLLTVEGVITRQEKDRLESWWERVFSGIGNAFRGRAFSVGQDSSITPVMIGDGVGDLGNAELTTEKREAISTALGVPHSLLMSNASNYATAEADRLSFYDFTIRPQAQHIQSVLNSYLFDPLGLKFVFKPDALPVYRENENDRSSAFATYVSAGLPMAYAAELLQIPLPEGIDYSTLATEEPEEPEEETASNEIAQESRRFREWYLRRRRKRQAIDPDKFQTDLLSASDKAAIISTLEPDPDPFASLEVEKSGDAAGKDAPFPVGMEWESYP